MRALSATQIKTCEESATPRCRCRCHGALHGIRQGEMRQEPLLPEDNQLHPIFEQIKQAMAVQGVVAAALR